MNKTELRSICPSDEIAETIWKMIKHDLDPCSVSEQARKRDAASYHRHDRATLIMEAADELLGTYGVEGWAIGFGRAGVQYCNKGDTYDATLRCKTNADGHSSFSIGCWGDMVN